MGLYCITTAIVDGNTVVLDANRFHIQTLFCVEHLSVVGNLNNIPWLANIFSTISIFIQKKIDLGDENYSKPRSAAYVRIIFLSAVYFHLKLDVNLICII